MTDQFRDGAAAVAEGSGKSPIEALMRAALVFCIGVEMQVRHAKTGQPVAPLVDIRFQHPVGKYRLDMALLGKGCKVAIECDGHAFHERTKEQAAHDRSRDRYLAEQGFTVLRFTGSEIWNGYIQCAEQAFQLARARIEEHA